MAGPRKTAFFSPSVRCCSQRTLEQLASAKYSFSSRRCAQLIRALMVSTFSLEVALMTRSLQLRRSQLPMLPSLLQRVGGSHACLSWTHSVDDIDLPPACPVLS